MHIFISQTEADKRNYQYVLPKGNKIWYWVLLERAPERDGTWGLPSPHQVLAIKLTLFQSVGGQIMPTNIFDISGAPAIHTFFSFFFRTKQEISPFLSFFPTSNEILQDKSNEKKRLGIHFFCEDDQ